MATDLYFSSYFPGNYLGNYWPNEDSDVSSIVEVADARDTSDGAVVASPLPIPNLPDASAGANWHNAPRYRAREPEEVKPQKKLTYISACDGATSRAVASAMVTRVYREGLVRRLSPSAGWKVKAWVERQAAATGLQRSASSSEMFRVAHGEADIARCTSKDRSSLVACRALAVRSGARSLSHSSGVARSNMLPVPVRGTVSARVEVEQIAEFSPEQIEMLTAIASKCFFSD